ncbi:MAG: 30S ribosomal protein S4 [Bacteroidetes bacterium]|jgi:small subunit ribosomal protein S4|nr:30S ribosomal protein S4 [Bacteroidota bacterium]
MARYRGPKQKIARRFKEPIFGYSRALERKNYGPGQHGKTRRTKQSEFATQLMEKQKAKFMYGMLEKQFRITFQRAARLPGSTGDNLIKLLEARLDNTLYRMGFAPTRRAARQLVVHKHVKVNGQVVNIPSYSLKPGDQIEIRERSKSLEVITESASTHNARYNWLEVDRNTYAGKFLSYPDRQDVPESIEERMIVELYSR